jgi:ligand-binding sensor domain-containing protein
MTIVAIVKCKNGYIVLAKEEGCVIYSDSADWKPDTAHVFTEYNRLMDWLFDLFEVAKERHPA